MRPLLAAALLVPLSGLIASPAAAQPGLERMERLPGGVERVGYRVPFEDTTDARLDVTVRIGDVSLRRRVLYPAETDTVGEPVRAFELSRAGRRLGGWETPYSGAWDRGFDLLRSDLDADGTRELIVLQHESEGNGLGVATWSVSIVPETGGDRPLVFSTVDYGPTGLVVQRPNGRRLMVASWEDGTEPGRGGGLYYTARFFRYDRGTLVADGPVLQRRFLFSFADLRGRESEAGRYHPDRWIRRGVRTAPRDPWIPGGARLASDVVTLVEPVPGEGIRVRHSDGRTAVVPVGLLGDAASGRPYPYDYVPLGQTDAWFAGRTARLDAYSSPYAPDERIHVLWLTR